MAADIESGLVGLWSDKSNTDERFFACSGFFVGPGLILTVKHVFEGRDWGKLWVRPQVEGQTAIPILSKPDLHPRLDGALLKIEQMPRGAAVLSLDRGPDADFKANAYSLHGFHEGRLDSGSSLTLHSFDSEQRYHLTSPKHPVGHSGSAVVGTGGVWGITTGHYVDPNTHRGCVISIHQLWEGWLADKLPPTAPALAVGATAPPSPGLAAVAAVPVPVPVPVPVHRPGQSRDQLKTELRSLVTEAFKAACWQQHPGLPLREGLPQCLHDALAQGDAPIGQRCVEAMQQVATVADRAVSSREPKLSARARADLREQLFAAMGCAAKLCLNLAALPDLANANLIWQVPANFVETGTLVARRHPAKSWQPNRYQQAQVLSDAHAIVAPLESGEGDDLLDDLMRLAWASVVGAKVKPPALSTEMANRLPGLLRVQANEGRGRFFVIQPVDREKFTDEVCAKAHQLGLSLLVLQGNDGRLFFFDESHLVAELSTFVHRFAENSEWTTN